MTIGVYSNILNRVAQRIEDKQTTLSIDHLQVGAKPDNIQAGDTYVLINYDNPFISEEYGRAVQQRNKDGTMNLVIWCHVPLNDRDSTDKIDNLSNVVDGALANIIDDEGYFLVGSEGVHNVIRFMEGILDAINTQPDETLNASIVDSSLSMGMSIGNVQSHDSHTDFEIFLSIRSIPFTINNRQQN